MWYPGSGVVLDYIDSLSLRLLFLCSDIPVVVQKSNYIMIDSVYNCALASSVKQELLC